MSQAMAQLKSGNSQGHDSAEDHGSDLSHSGFCDSGATALAGEAVFESTWRQTSVFSENTSCPGSRRSRGDSVEFFNSERPESSNHVMTP